MPRRDPVRPASLEGPDLLGGVGCGRVESAVDQCAAAIARRGRDAHLVGITAAEPAATGALPAGGTPPLPANLVRHLPAQSQHRLQVDGLARCGRPGRSSRARWPACCSISMQPSPPEAPGSSATISPTAKATRVHRPAALRPDGGDGCVGVGRAGWPDPGRSTGPGSAPIAGPASSSTSRLRVRSSGIGRPCCGVRAGGLGPLRSGAFGTSQRATRPIRWTRRPRPGSRTVHASSRGSNR
jgi:hypothetical protein